jgi:tetratricopeptide (TPR) repeat protein
MAIQEYKKAMNSAPTFLAPRMAIARLSAMGGRYEDTVSELEEVLAINDEYLPACMSLGDIYYLQGNNKQAEKYYRAALKIENGYGYAANNLAYILSSYDNKLTEALSLAQTAVKKLPNDATARDTLGWIHYRMGNTYQALSEIEESLSLNPNYALANYHMGLLCYKNREFAKAREYIKKALEIDPDFEEAEDAREMLDM